METLAGSMGAAQAAKELRDLAAPGVPLEKWASLHEAERAQALEPLSEAEQAAYLEAHAQALQAEAARLNAAAADTLEESGRHLGRVVVVCVCIALALVVMVLRK